MIRGAGRGRALVVDDDPNVLGLLTSFLEAEGWEVRYAGDGPSALEKFHTARFDLALVDLGMPGMTGLELATVFRRFDATVEIVLITDDGRAPDPAATAAAGIARVLRKPFRLDALLECVGARTREEMTT
jgi:DNA-binding response OmpR family regulator